MFAKSKDSDENNLKHFFMELLRTNHEFKRFLKQKISYCPKLLNLKSQIATYGLHSADETTREHYESLVWLLNNLEKTWKKWQYDIASNDKNYRQLNHYTIDNLLDAKPSEKAQRLKYLFEIQKQKLSVTRPWFKESPEHFIKRIDEKYRQLSKSKKEIIYYWNQQLGHFDLTLERRDYPHN